MGGEEGDRARLRDPHLISPNLHCKYVCFAGLEFEKKKTELKTVIVIILILHCTVMHSRVLCCAATQSFL